ncbi:tRNA epoxyqueuosine(34) reductase QueG [Candidatus Kapaibacterium sp.]
MEKVITNNALKDKIIKRALTEGFQDIKFARYQLLSEEINRYKEWIQKNNHATMQWMERNLDKREDVALILNSVKSVIVLSYNYYTGNIYPQNFNSDQGIISRYAWGSDYHEILEAKLKTISGYINELSPNSISKYYIDTGPTLDKQWAVKSGLGWQGKNSLVISPKYGSYFFIALIFSNLEFDPDNQIKDYCGTCTKCIDHCPTNAIVDSKIIDSNKCISYWTIEAKPDIDIPEHIAENSNNRIYGCDICQEVCPWNKHKPVITDELQFISRFENGAISKSKIDQMEQDEFSAIFRKSPIKRLKLKGLKRNSRFLLKTEN